jgi:hypothetical protein
LEIICVPKEENKEGVKDKRPAEFGKESPTCRTSEGPSTLLDEEKTLYLTGSGKEPVR